MTMMTQEQLQRQAEEEAAAAQVIERMMLGLGVAHRKLTSADKYWLVWVADDEPGRCQSFADLAGLTAKLTELKPFDPQLFLFYGRRLRMMVKPYLAVLDGDQELRLEEVQREFLGEETDTDTLQTEDAEVEAADPQPVTDDIAEPSYMPVEVGSTSLRAELDELDGEDGE